MTHNWINDMDKVEKSCMRHIEYDLDKADQELWEIEQWMKEHPENEDLNGEDEEYNILSAEWRAAKKTVEQLYDRSILHDERR